MDDWSCGSMSASQKNLSNHAIQHTTDPFGEFATKSVRFRGILRENKVGLQRRRLCPPTCHKFEEPKQAHEDEGQRQDPEQTLGDSAKKS
mmetsp:Transcript_102769/g.178257  ORF Transcript_102769/g.178257 Transcript_102769/m.178257 type:complete len:90 (+) Transcript_102769:68-337(+)